MEIETPVITEIDTAALHDILLEAGYFILESFDAIPEITENVMIRFFNLLPIGIRMTGFGWGLSDTVFGDNAYVFLCANEEFIKWVKGE